MKYLMNFCKSENHDAVLQWLIILKCKDPSSNEI